MITINKISGRRTPGLSPVSVCLAFFPVAVFLVALSPIFLRREAFFTAAGFFLDFTAGVLRFFMAGVFRAFRLAAFEALAEVAGAFTTVFLIPGFAMGVFLAPALAAFLEAAEFGAAMVLTSGRFGGQWDTVQGFFKMDNISMTALYLC